MQLLQKPHTGSRELISYANTACFRLTCALAALEHLMLGRARGFSHRLYLRCRCPDCNFFAIFICIHVVRVVRVVFHDVFHLFVISDDVFSPPTEIIGVIISRRHPPSERPPHERPSSRRPPESRPP